MDKLTVKKAQKIINKIEKLKSDPEAAHSYESNLRSRFIDEISKGYHKDPIKIIELAKIIISTDKISFPRWTA